MHSWDDFKYFLAVVNTGSYSQAAKTLGVNHSTISRRIQAMEDKHGVRLLERTHTGYKMTEAGCSIYEIVKSIEAESFKAARILQGQDARLEGEINLTMPHDVFDFILAEPLKAFNQQHPSIQFNLLLSQGLRNMANREADIAVRITAKPPEHLIGSRICQLRYGIYQNSTLPYQKFTPIVVWNTQKEIPEWAISHIKSPKIVLRVDDLYSMYQAVKAGFGIARMPCFLPDILAEKSIYRLPISLPFTDWGVWVLSHVDLRNTARINRCRSFLKDTLIAQAGLFKGELSE